MKKRVLLAVCLLCAAHIALRARQRQIQDSSAGHVIGPQGSPQPPGLDYNPYYQEPDVWQRLSRQARDKLMPPRPAPAANRNRTTSRNRNNGNN